MYLHLLIEVLELDHPHRHLVEARQGNHHCFLAVEYPKVDPHLQEEEEDVIHHLQEDHLLLVPHHRNYLTGRVPCLLLRLFQVYLDLNHKATLLLRLLQLETQCLQVPFQRTLLRQGPTDSRWSQEKMLQCQTVNL